MELVNFVLQLVTVLCLSLAAGSVGAKSDSFWAPSEVFTESSDSRTLYGAAGHVKCTSDEHAEPTSTQDVSDTIHRLNDAGRPFKVRATRRGAHTPNRLVCSGTSYNARLPTGENLGVSNIGPTTYSVTILMHRMNRVLAVDHEQFRLTVEAGMTVQNLADAAVRNGMSIPVGVFPVYGNLTVSGLISASAHGTGAGVDSSLGDIVTGIKWVNGKGNIITSDIADDTGRSEIRAFIGGLGVLGVLTEVTFQLLPPGALAQVETWTRDDSNIAADVLDQLQSSTPHILYFWRPDLHYYKAFHWKPLKDGDIPQHPYKPNGRNTMLGPTSEASAMKHQLADYTADLDESRPDSDVLNEAGCKMSDAFLNIGVFGDKDGYFENATIPTSHAMIAEECDPQCVWDMKYHGATVEDNEWTFKLSQLEDWVKDVRAIIKAEEQERQDHLDRRYGKGKVRLCMPPGFFWLRFGKGSKNLLATTAGIEEPVVYAMSTFFASAYNSYIPTKADHINEVLEQVTLCKYKARPHYGKNFDRIFTHPECHLRDNFPEENIAKLLALQKLHDPLKVFQPELLTRVLERQGPVYGDKCSLVHNCYCKEDSHCADGFKCQPSVSYPQYNVCKVQYPHQKNRYSKEEL